MSPLHPDFAHPRLRLALRLAAALVVLALCGWAASKLDWRGAARAMAGAHVDWLLLAAALNLPFLLLQSLRWRVLLRPVGQPPLVALLRYLLASRAASNLLPARAGELLRIYLPRVRDGLPAVSLASVLVIERFFDAFGLASVSAPLLVLPSAPRWVRSGLLLLLGTGATGAVLVALFARRGGARGRSWVDRITQLAAGLRSPAAVGQVFGLTLLCWLSELGMVLGCLAAVDLPPTAVHGLVVLLAVNLGMVLQVTPGNVGPFEAAVLLALTALDIGGPRATALAVLYHMVALLPVTLAGLEGLRFVGEARRPPR